MERARALRFSGPGLVRVALIALVLAAGPGVSAVGVFRSSRFRDRPYLLAPDAGFRPALPPSVVPEAVRQSRPQTCGPAALATVLAWQGRPVGEGAVTARARLRADGVTLAELARLAGAFELPARWYRVRSRDLARLPTPFIAHLRTKGGHYVAVARVARGFVLLADPAIGVTLERTRRFRRDWSRRVMLFDPPARQEEP